MNSLTLPAIPTKITKSEFGGFDCEPSSWFVGEPKPVPNYDGLFTYSVWYQKGDGYFIVASNITYEKDARLIAAAPRLLAACETALHELRVRCGYKGKEAAYAELSEATAEATGKGNANHYAIYQLADDKATYGPNAGKFIVTTRNQEDEVAGPMSEKDARSLAAALNACQMVRDRWERGDLAEAARACTRVVATASGRAA